ncbi:MAG: CopG family transcriptional regulator [Caldilinea sp. CFX5]|nr:CopG family transcriptional regulator [Caldilinea sp. CFX5]
MIPDGKEEKLGYLRVVDESGEDYTFPANYFEPIEPNHTNGKELDAQITVHINEVDKEILRAEALASQKSVSALIREWIEERLDLPLAA